MFLNTVADGMIVVTKTLCLKREWTFNKCPQLLYCNLTIKKSSCSFSNIVNSKGQYFLHYKSLTCWGPFLGCVLPFSLLLEQAAMFCLFTNK